MAVTDAAPTATVTLDRKTLDDVMLGQAQFPALMQSGAIKIDGDRMAFLNWFALHPAADPRFNVVVPQEPIALAAGVSTSLDTTGLDIGSVPTDHALKAVA